MLTIAEELILMDRMLLIGKNFPKEGSYLNTLQVACTVSVDRYIDSQYHLHA